jgi:hypothetical protein
LTSHIRILGWLYIITCSLALAAGILLLALLAVFTDPTTIKARESMAPAIIVVSLIGFLPGIYGGIGLVRMQFWSRGFMLLISAVMLFLLPVGTALGLYGFWVLLHAETKAILDGRGPSTSYGGSYGQAGSGYSYVESDPAPQYGNQPGAPPSNLPLVFWSMAYVGAGFFLALKIGFLLHNDPKPAPFENLALTIIAVLIMCVALLKFGIWLGRKMGEAATTASIKKTAHFRSRERSAERRKRVAELLADPAKAKYAPLVERGEDWPDEKIAFLDGRGATETCEHLVDIERAMQSAGIALDWARPGQLNAGCRIDFERLKIVFNLDSTVRYAEFYIPERSERDHPTASLSCAEHSSAIWTKHPEENGADRVPVFPTSTA